MKTRNAYSAAITSTAALADAILSDMADAKGTRQAKLTTVLRDLFSGIFAGEVESVGRSGVAWLTLCQAMAIAEIDYAVAYAATGDAYKAAAEGYEVPKWQGAFVCGHRVRVWGETAKATASATRGKGKSNGKGIVSKIEALDFTGLDSRDKAKAKAALILKCKELGLTVK